MEIITFINETLILKIMQRQKLVCSSCKKNVANSKGTAVFNCPSCGKEKVVRCMHCRKIAAKYTCPSCSFEGPN